MSLGFWFVLAYGAQPFRMGRNARWVFGFVLAYGLWTCCFPEDFGKNTLMRTQRSWKTKGRIPIKGQLRRRRMPRLKPFGHILASMAAFSCSTASFIVQPVSWAPAAS